jgi:hypothetical protein
VIDINPRKIGATVHGIAVVPPEALPKPASTFTIITVGAPGARNEIRNWLAPRGYKEGVDFIFCA